ncbi:MAG TPA: tRNA-dihydrouridine synthase [Candidatus Thermoplasmatota archaeon]|nr:tRNA-dihydrouridine synthase [Candidatus Thermoplasmatota archaeon]
MPDLLRPLTLGNVRLPNNLVLSPMAGFSDLPFRVLCRRHGAGLVCSEMVSANGVLREVKMTLQRMRTLEGEAPMSIQLFGTDEAQVEQAARDLDRRCAVVGFNMGCPAHQIKRAGCGAAMLDKPDLALRMVEAVKRGTDKPLLVKMRLANCRPIDVVAFARGLERAGADGLIVHGRTAAQGYSGKADWDAIGRVKQAVGIPVVGNGDVVDGPSAERALRSGVDGIALGRATLGNPRVFREVAHYLATGERLPPATGEERLHDFLAYLEMAEALGLPEHQVREQAQQFTRGLRGGPDLRREFARGIPLPEVVARFQAHVGASATVPAAPTP